MLYLYLEWLMSGNIKKWLIIGAVILALGIFLAQVL